ncbi:transglycosylase family protein [Streptomyces sp. NBC_00873]|uniref:transglycosylase family protein n=1 Tax=unclassified Streptomyces TaxID=2593676 RepID=UPI003863A883|nr:transglycosylase family protein [Streptomyces sp. NBC_00873]WTA44257.1 transglycosylase family protein [Streptomyces sp. NBC_00842]
MGSANGRHRRPRQAPAIVVAAGVTGSAIAIPLLGAAGAHAADATTWDRVAECESGGMWSADLGNGFYGGLQFSQDAWKSYGGEAYAPRADLASRSQQIAVAEKVLEDQGSKAWPSCVAISGLTEDGVLPGVDPGVVPSAEPAESGDASDSPSAKASATPSGKASATPSDKASHKPSAEPAATSPSKKSDSFDSPRKSDSSGDEAGGKHRGAPAPEVSQDTDRGGDRDSGRHASRGNSEGRDTRAVAADGDYTVRPGDNLWAIADAQKVPGGWPALYEANKGAVGSDPDLILPGQSLDLGVKSK